MKTDHYTNFIRGIKALQDKKKKEAIEQHQKAIQQKNKKLEDYSIEERLVNKEPVNDQVVEKGKLIKVRKDTLIPTEFVAQFQYQGQTVQAIAHRNQIVRKNILALLDYYEDTLRLTDISI